MTVLGSMHRVPDSVHLGGAHILIVLIRSQVMLTLWAGEAKFESTLLGK